MPSYPSGSMTSSLIFLWSSDNLPVTVAADRVIPAAPAGLGHSAEK